MNMSWLTDYIWGEKGLKCVHFTFGCLKYVFKIVILYQPLTTKER